MILKYILLKKQSLFPTKKATNHLEKALILISNRESPDYANSIKESISAVEAICSEILGKSDTLGSALKKAGTELLEPYLSFKIYAPQEYLSRAYNDAPKYCANIVDTQLKNNEVILSGEIPARCIQEYRSDLTFFTNGRSVCLTELKGYHVTTGEPSLPAPSSK